MDSIQMETKYCDNCKKDVPVGNYLNHSIHCPKNIRLCPKCDEPYPIIEMEKHLATDHEEVVCPDCYVFMEAIDLPTHQTDSCARRLVSCLICEVDLPACELSDHLDYCGSRSERCDGCGKTVLMKYRAFHVFSKHALTKPENERQLAQSTLSFLSEYSSLHAGQDRSAKTPTNAARPASSSRDLSSNSSDARLPANSNKSLVDVTGSCGESSNAPKLGSGFSTASLPAPSSAVLAMLEPVFNTPSNSQVAPSSNESRTQQKTPSMNAVTSRSEQKTPSMNAVTSRSEQKTPSIMNAVTSRSEQKTPSTNGVSSTSCSEVASRNVDAAINECVKSICAGLKVTSKTNASSNALANSNINNSFNKTSNDPRSTNSSTSSTSRSSSASNLGSPYACANATSAQCFLDNSHNASPTVLAERKVMASGLSNGMSGSASSPSQFKTAIARPSSTPADLTRTTRAVNSNTGEVGPRSNAHPPPRREVLLPEGAGPRITPVNQAPTRTRNFSDDAINEYMHRLEEQGLSGGLSSTPSQAKSESKQCAEASASTTSRNAIREKVAQIRREREEKLAEARATRTSVSIVPPPRPHIAAALNIMNASRPEPELAAPRGGGMAESRYRPRDDEASLWPEHADTVSTASADRLLARLTRAMPRDSEFSLGRARVRSGEIGRQPANRPTRPNNFDALTHPRPRRDEALTRAELRGLNEALEVDRQAQNRGVEDEAALCLPCEFCDAPIPMDHLILHQTGCRPDLIYH